MSVVSATCYELLGVPVEAPARDLESAWKLRRREAERRLGALPAEEVEALCARVDEAFQILADPIRAQRYRRYRAHMEAAEDAPSPVPAPDDEWGSDPDAVVTDPGLAAWNRGLAAVTDDVEPAAPVGDLELLADVVRAAAQAPLLPDPRDLAPWRSPDAPVVQAAALGAHQAPAPAAFGPGEARRPPPPPPWSR